MTNGTSQGLYVIIAVVIFGIFVGISYLIFQDSLRPKLNNIFNTSLNKGLLYLNDRQVLKDLNMMTDFNTFLTPQTKDKFWSVSHKGTYERTTEVPSGFSKNIFSNNVVKISQTSEITDYNWVFAYQNITKYYKELPLKKGDTVLFSTYVYIPENVPEDSFVFGFFNKWDSSQLLKVSERNKWVFIEKEFILDLETDKLTPVIGLNNVSKQDFFFYIAGASIKIIDN